MNNLDKYFEKARNVEPGISQEETRKILAGKLSDGGIATNLLNKIRTYPMITTLITSAAIVGVLMLSQFTEPTNENIVDSKNKIEIIADNGEDGIIPVDDNEPKTRDHKKEKEFEKKNPPKPNDDSLARRTKIKRVKLDSKDNIWTSDEVDVKQVNTLTLSADELDNLGISIDKDNFKVNAFDKYTFTIYEDNNKERNPYKNDEKAYPTPAMVTTASGFKTLTLFKSDGLEAIVDRVKSEDGDSQSLRMTTEIKSEVDFDIDENLPEFKFGEMSFDDYKTMLSGHKDSAKVINRIESLEDIKLKIGDKEMTFKLKDLLKSGEMSPDAIEKFMKIKELEGEVEDDITMKVEMDVNSEDGTRNEFRYVQKKIDRKVNLTSEDLSDEDIEKIMITSLDSLDGDGIVLVETDADVRSSNSNGSTIHMPIKSLREGKKIKIVSNNSNEITDEQLIRLYDSVSANTVYDTQLDDDVYVRDLLQRSGDNVDIKELKSVNVNSKVLNGSALDLSKLSELNSLNKLDGLSNMSFSLIKHDINKLIPIEVSLGGDKTDFIVWYEATDEFLEKLPSRLIQKINPELNAADDQAEHCNNEPVKKDDAVMDVWSGCSGAIQGMKLYPNPAVDQSSVELSLKEDRSLSMAVYNLSGKLIKRIGNPTQYAKGQLVKPIDLTGINPGLYYVVVKSDLGEQALQRIIIE
ncbi:MAG: T9SS type A sorting domain-containing protein [Chlorobiota bacterium]